ncbi:Uma2 family endonuclease [Actinomadura spongiicola]|uniref:Uma2 family endonuclease n=1 Tax=Actinomadura spongiicola TaxID=2303421 RepID=UPI001F164462|nr:Uma2 family endonuclease [Actinomadura spongiicola]
MTVRVDESLAEEADVLLEGFLALDTPEGFRAELIDGEIVVTPPPVGDHEHCVAPIIEQIIRNSAIELECSGNKGLRVPGVDGHPDNRVIPDITFVCAERDAFRGAPAWMPAADDTVIMVVEVTSARPERDRVAKRNGYARAGIPFYLLVDPERGQGGPVRSAGRRRVRADRAVAHWQDSVPAGTVRGGVGHVEVRLSRRVSVEPSS